MPSTVFQKDAGWAVLGSCYTEDAGLPYFNRTAVKATGNWYYTSALESMGVQFCFHYHSVNIGPSYK